MYQGLSGSTFSPRGEWKIPLHTEYWMEKGM
jgi:hypothetical protein